jgi:2-(1,2-epoxy-1,2-dihydrophenyl)acetyl-CoA isomerase
MADLAVCAESAKFNLAYTTVGLTPDASTSFLLPRAIGAKRAMELFLLNRTIDANEAVSWGLVNRAVPEAQLLAEALKMGEQLAAGPAGALGQTKRLLTASLGPLESQMVLESQTIAARAGSEEGQEGIAAFLEKRKPEFN